MTTNIWWKSISAERDFLGICLLSSFCRVGVWFVGTRFLFFSLIWFDFEPNMGFILTPIDPVLTLNPMVLSPFGLPSRRSFASFPDFSFFESIR